MNHEQNFLCLQEHITKETLRLAMKNGFLEKAQKEIKLVRDQLEKQAKYNEQKYREMFCCEFINR